MDNLMFLAFLYLLPTFLAFARESPSRYAVAALNITLGWTGFMWIISFLLAMQHEQPEQPEHQCPQCDRSLSPGLNHCTFCGHSMALASKGEYSHEGRVIVSR